MVKRLNVLVVDDQTLVNEGICRLLELSQEINVIGTAADGAEALTLIDKHHPDVMLLDIRMEGMDGISTLKEMRKRKIELPTLLLTTFNDQDYITQGISLGADGYLLKDVTLDQLVETIKKIVNGEKCFPRTSEEKHHTLDALTDREVDIMRLICEGQSNKEIAKTLFLQEGTVKNHITNIFAKLQVRDRTQAALKYRNNFV